MANIFVVAHHSRTEIPELLSDLRQWATSRGHELWMNDFDAQALNSPELANPRHAMDADLVVSLGWVPERAVGVDHVVRAPTLMHSGQVALVLQVAQEVQGRALGDAHRCRDVADPRIGVATDVHEHMAVV